jgi:hypothetical protein
MGWSTAVGDGECGPHSHGNGYLRAGMLCGNDGSGIAAGFDYIEFCIGYCKAGSLISEEGTLVLLSRAGLIRNISL